MLLQQPSKQASHKQWIDYSHASWTLLSFRSLVVRSFLISILILVDYPAEGCTNVLVTAGASTDGGPLIAYNADSVDLVGYLYHYPAMTYVNAAADVEIEKKQKMRLPKNNHDDDDDDGGGKHHRHKDNSRRMKERIENERRDDDVYKGKMRKIYTWDTGEYRGEIAEISQTYNVVGNMNEHGLVIGETTFGGVPVLDPKHQREHSILDYGSLIYVALQRCKTAREAIRTMSSLMQEYGYASSGESFSIADAITREVWIMEIIGKGPEGKGAVWVARKIPDGYISAHANQARIQTFPRDDPDSCLYSHDVVDLAVRLGLYQRTASDGNDDDFSFSDTYDPVSFTGARFNEARVWDIFSSVAEDDAFEQTYLDYITGRNINHRMPLWIKPRTKLTLRDVMKLMNSHYEGTALDFRSDVGAGAHAAPYRPRPLLWDYEGVQYHNERAISDHRTGWNFVSQIRPWMPLELSAILWFAADDSSTTPRYPVYASSTRISQAYVGLGPQDGVISPLLTLDLTKAFWVQNMVSNLAYTRWDDMYPILWDKIDRIQRIFSREVEQVDNEALKLYNDGDINGAIEYVTKYSVHAGDTLHQTWFHVYGELFTRFRDFYEIVPSSDDDAMEEFEITETGFSNEWKKRIVEETGDHYRVTRRVEMQALARENTNDLHNFDERDEENAAYQNGPIDATQHDKNDDDSGETNHLRASAASLLLRRGLDNWDLSAWYNELVRLP